MLMWPLPLAAPAPRQIIEADDTIWDQNAFNDLVRRRATPRGWRGASPLLGAPHSCAARKNRAPYGAPCCCLRC